MSTRCLLAAAAAVLCLPSLRAQEPGYTRKEDVIYGRKFGTALTMDVFTPKGKPNGAGIIFCVSGGWRSDKDMLTPGNIATYVVPFTERGYVVFTVMHG